MTAREDALHEAWRDLADAEAEHDQPWCVRAWQRIRELQTPAQIHHQLIEQERDCE